MHRVLLGIPSGGSVKTKTMMSIIQVLFQTQSVGELEIDDIAFGGFSVSVATPRGLTRAIERGIGGR